MSVRIHILSSSPDLKRYGRRLKKLSEDAVKRIGRLLPLSAIDIVFYENPNEAISEIGGIGGYAPNAHTILVSLDPKNPKFARAIKHELFGTLAHEIHHAIRWRKPGYGSTLLEALVTEGLADHFSIEAGVLKPPPWINALRPAERMKLLKRAKRLFHGPYKHTDWFFGSKKNKIPHWTGYSLGYYLVGEYLKRHPEAKASTLVSTKALVIVSA